MNITSLEVSKKLKRYGLIQGNSEYYYSKRLYSSDYDIEYKTKIRLISIDGLLWWELTKLAISLGFDVSEVSEVRCQNTADEQAFKLIELCIFKKIRLDYKPPVTILEQQKLF